MKFNELPTPVYIIDEEKLIKNLTVLHNLEIRTGCKILLAQKAFSAFFMYPLISRYISGTTASGLFEARLGAEEFGKETHVFSPAYKPDEFDELCKMSGHIVFNSFTQLEKYREKWEQENISIGIRIN
ncbi:MAG: carboxynorspermidine decarboxylase, partial [Bacillota bacterium]|nr:carboxynorspermidine decarboxylase [Bacillota bacterium]